MSFVYLRKALVVSILLLSGTLFLKGQAVDVDHSYKPLTLKLDESGSKYIRFITWHQIWAQTNNLSVEGAKLQVNPMISGSKPFFSLMVLSPIRREQALGRGRVSFCPRDRASTTRLAGPEPGRC